MAKKKKKYYWLKLQKDFFKRHDTRIIESMDNGKDYILFYLKLLVESIDHEGNLRFSESIPYNDKMLATITNTNVDIVRSAVKIFSELGLMQTLDDETLYMKDIETMIGSETEWAEKKRLQRDATKALELENEDIVQAVSIYSPPAKNTLSDKSIETESRVRDIELDKEKKKEQSPFQKSSSPFQSATSPSYKIDSSVKRWNEKPGLPKTRKLLVNLGEQARPIIESVNLYSADEIHKAIDNYQIIISDTSKYKPIAKYGDVFGFLKTGIEKYWDESEPFKNMSISGDPVITTTPEQEEEDMKSLREIFGK